MRHSVQDHIPVLNREHGAPVALPQSKCPRLPNERNHARVVVPRRFGDFLKPIQQSLRLCSGQTGKLLEYLWRDDQGQTECSLIASTLSTKRHLPA
jgi:hypothetical protein